MEITTGHRITLQKPKHNTLQKLQLSPRQATEVEQFMKSFHSVDDLIVFFAPSHWPYALAHIAECLTAPCISLAQVDELYHTKGTAQNIIRAQFVGIYSLSTAREAYNEQASSLAAGMFLARYGNICNLYDMLLYFSSYLLEYKQSYSAYDVQDILLQFSRKYIPWRRSRTHSDEAEATTKGTPLEECVLRWVRKGQSDEEFHAMWLYEQGRITDELIQSARDQYAAELADGCF